MPISLPPPPDFEVQLPPPRRIESRFDSGTLSVALCVIGLLLSLCVGGMLAFLWAPDNLPTNTTSERLPLGLVLGLLFLGGCAFFLLCGASHFILSRIIADEEGLSWRDTGKWKRVPWSQVTDYYLTLLSGEHRFVKAVETSVGVLRFDASRTNEHLLAQAIEQRATQARARGWFVQGSDVLDGPREFTYTDPRLRRFSFSTLEVLLFVVMTAMALTMRDTVLLIFWAYSVCRFFYSLCEKYQMAHEPRHRLNQRIVVDEGGILFQSDEYTLYAPWEAVADYYLASGCLRPRLPIRHVVVTQKGTFDFVNISENERLRRVIMRYATHVPRSFWMRQRSSNSQALHQV